MSTSVSFHRVSGLTLSELRKIGDNMAKEIFTRDTSAGFLIEQVSTRSIKARHIHKFIEKEVTETPFGETTEFARITYTEQPFILQLEWPNLVLFESSFPYPSLLGRLAEFSDFQIGISEIEVDLGRWLTSFQTEFDDVTVYGVRVGEIFVQNGVTAKVAFEGEGDFFDSISRFIGKRAYSFDTLKLRFTFSRHTRKCELKRSGSLRIYGELDSTLVKRCLNSMKALNPK